MSDKLTPKQEAFVRAYLKTGNASDAYRMAYDAQDMKPESVNREAKALLDHPKIAPRIQSLIDKAAEKSVLSKAWVLERLMRNARIAMGEEPVRMTKTFKDKETGTVTEVVLEVIDPDKAGANRALELLGKELGMFVDRAEVGGPGDFDQMSDDELREFVAGRVIAAREGNAGTRKTRGSRKAGEQLN
jgi:phage terminase small subunit